MLRETAPVQIGVSGLTPAAVEVALDGDVIYKGDSLPQDLALKAAELESGEHELALFLVDQSGVTQRDSEIFHVEHARLVTPLEHGQILQGETTLDIELLISPNELDSVSISMARVIGGERARRQVVYSGSVLPDPLVLDTLEFEDGAYDLVVSTKTRPGVTSSNSYRVVIDNWVFLEDAILPPDEKGWFGVIEQLKTVSKSFGWEHVIGDGEHFFGDDDRIRPSGESDEYLTWELPNLRTFSITAYGRTADAAGVLEVHTSADGETWRAAKLVVDSAGGPQNGWQKLVITGTLSGGDRYLRVTVSGDAGNPIQIGHVLLKGDA